jgi:hypothetical protein
MPVRTTYRNDGGVAVKSFGTVTGADLLRVSNHLYSSLDTNAKLEYQLWDFSHVDTLILTEQEVQTFKEQDKQATDIVDKQLIAIIADQEQIADLSRLWQTVSDNGHVISAIFSDKAAAESWLVTQRAELASYLSLM